MPTVGIPSNFFFSYVKGLLDNSFGEYVVILRLNCEGAEDDVIYAASEQFKDRLVLVMGSLKDVEGCKGREAYNNLIDFLKGGNLPFVFFSSSVISWKSAHAEICTVLQKHACIPFHPVDLRLNVKKHNANLRDLIFQNWISRLRFGFENKLTAIGFISFKCASLV